jgi:hypothetical protein
MTPKKSGVNRQRLILVEAMSGVLFWSIGSGVIWKGVLLVREINVFSNVPGIE